MHLPFGPTIAPLGIYPRYTVTKICPIFFICLIFDNRALQKNRGIANKIWYIQTVEYYTTINMIE